MPKSSRYDQRSDSRRRGVAQLVELGECLRKLSFSGPGLFHDPRPDAEEEKRLRDRIGTLELELDEFAYDRSKRVFRSALGLRGQDILFEPLALRAMAYVAHHWLIMGAPGPSVPRTSRAAGLGSLDDAIEARRIIHELIIQGNGVAFRDGSIEDGELLVGPALLRFLSGERRHPLIWTEQSMRERREQWERDKSRRACGGQSKRARASDRSPSISAGTNAPAGTARDIYEQLRPTVIGMDPTVRRFSVHMATHMKRVETIRRGETPSVGPVVLLLIGPSGSGKTFLAQQLGLLANLPFASADLSQTSSAAYVGQNFGECFQGLIQPGRKIADVECGILLLDEADKSCAKSSSHSEADPMGAGLQAEILRALEGCQQQVGGHRSNDSRRATINTYGMTFLLAGAFRGIETVVRDMSRTQGGLGFGTGSPNRGNGGIHEVLTTYGMLPELVNRIGAAIVFPEPSVKQLIAIATHPNGVIAKQNLFLNSFGFSLDPTRPAIEELAEWARATGTYARGLKNVLGIVSEETIFAAETGILKVTVDDVRRAIATMDASQLKG